jgi:hypothetical protein
MQNDLTILGGIDPDISEHIATRREAIRQGATMSSGVAAALALGSIPVALAALSRTAYGQGTPADVQAVIDFALILEIFENEFYKAVLGTSASAAQNAAFVTVRAMVPAAALPALQQIQGHEQDHVDFLTANGAVNTLNLDAGSFDFTGGRGTGTGPFAQATVDLNHLLAVAQGAEDTGVRAYKGQAPNLMSNTVVLESALRIHSVEARHASKIRRLRRQTGAPAVVKYSGTISGGGAAAAGAGNLTAVPAAATAAFALIYEGEGNTTQAGVNITTLPNLPSGIDVTAAATEAFDEPLTKEQVVAIVQPFFIPDLS